MARKKSKKTLKVILISLAVITVVGFLSNASGLFGQAEETTEYIDPNENFSGWHLVNNVNQLKDGDDIIFVSDLLPEPYILTPISNYYANSISFNYNINSLNNNGEIYISEYRNPIFRTKLLDDKFSFKSIYGYMSFVNSKISFVSDNEDSTLFNLSFENDYTLLNYRNSFLDTSGQNFYVSDSSNNIKIFKWYGNEECNFGIDISGYDYTYMFDEFEMKSFLDYELQPGDVVCPIKKVGDTYYSIVNECLGLCGDTNIVVPIEFVGNGFAINELELSFYEVKKMWNNYNFLCFESVVDSAFNPTHDHGPIEEFIVQWYEYDYDTWRDNNFHSSYITYESDETVKGELGFYICEDYYNSPGNSPKCCHFGSSKNSLDGEYDTQNLIGIYGQITHWLVQKK